jgi:hypothetical protein
VGGVTEEEDVAVSPAVRQLRPEGVLRHAQELQLVARDGLDPGSDERLESFNGLEVGGCLALEEAELPAVAGVPDPHIRRSPVRVADLVHAFPLVELDHAGHVDHQPALLELEIFHG